MNVTKLNRARRKLALQITEDIERWIARHNGVLDVDEAAKDIAYLISDTRAEAQAEFEEFHKSLDRLKETAQKPSLYRELCTALELDGCSVTVVLKAAIKAVEDRKQLREVLRDVQWVTTMDGMGSSSYPTCVGCGVHSCGTMSTQPHLSECKIEAALHPKATKSKRDQPQADEVRSGR